nr:12627_t:CDS:2 [Entrophospora candida]
MEEIFQELNEQQKQAVYEESPRICVIAGPGCGKTKTLVSRIIHLLSSQRAQPHNILVLTFAKKAIKEIKKRVFSYITDVSPKDLHIHNFHSFCFRVLNKHAHLLGFPEKKLQFSDIAILYRNNYLSSRIEMELAAQKIPYEILGSFKFIEREEIKDVLAICRTVIYQDNLSLLRMLSLQEKIGARTIEKIEKKSEEKGMSIYNYLNNFATIADLSQDKLATGQVEKIGEAVLKINNHQAKLAKKISLYTFLLGRRKEYINLDELLNNFLQWLVIAFEDKKLIKTRNNLILSSVHQAKGLEFEVVFFVYLDQGTLPYRETQDVTEEKRLFYVGITRAKRLLYLVSSQELYSPFLDELDKKNDLDEIRNVFSKVTLTTPEVSCKAFLCSNETDPSWEDYLIYEPVLRSMGENIAVIKYDLNISSATNNLVTAEQIVKHPYVRNSQVGTSNNVLAEAIGPISYLSPIYLYSGTTPSDLDRFFKPLDIVQTKLVDNIIGVRYYHVGIYLGDIGAIFLFARRGSSTNNQGFNLGEQQRQQVREAASQLIGSILDNQNSFNELTTNSNGTKRDIDEIEEVFLSNSLSPSPDVPVPIKVPNSLSPEIIEQSWYELRIFLTAGKDRGDYNKLLEKYLQIIKEVKTVQELFKEYIKARNDLIINQVDRSKELIAKGYSELDIVQLKE